MLPQNLSSGKTTHLAFSVISLEYNNNNNNNNFDERRNLQQTDANCAFCWIALMAISTNVVYIVYVYYATIRQAAFALKD